MVHKVINGLVLLAGLFCNICLKVKQIVIRQTRIVRTVIFAVGLDAVIEVPCGLDPVGARVLDGEQQLVRRFAQALVLQKVCQMVGSQTFGGKMIERRVRQVVENA